MVVHSINALKNGARHIEVSSGDTDVVIFLGKFTDLIAESSDVHLFLTIHSGKGLKHFNVNNIYAALGEDRCRALPMFHSLTGHTHIIITLVQLVQHNNESFTGCDTTSSFMEKGKKDCMKVLDDQLTLTNALLHFERN